MRLMLCAAMAAAVASPALADNPVCAERKALVERLTDRFGEEQLAMGLTDDGVVEVYASGETGTFTIVISLPDGSTCMLAAGGMWEVSPPAPKGDPL